MSYYHIYITSESNPSKEEIKLDLDTIQLNNRYIEPYNRGRPITINGKSISDLDRILIYRTEKPSEAYKPELRARESEARAAGAVLFAQLPISTFIKSVGDNVTDDFILGPPGSALGKSHGSSPVGYIGEILRVFVSHSSSDIKVVQGLVDLMQKALHLTSDDIRCTSLDGFGMAGGASIDDTLRAEVHDAELLIGIITPHSLRSAYVMFELGARWGAGRPMIPLLASGITADDLEEPLGSINALDSSQEGQVLQLVEDIAGYLNVEADKASSYSGATKELARLSRESATASGQIKSELTNPNVSDKATKLLIVASANDGSPIARLRMGNRLKITIDNSYFCNTKSARDAAAWDQAINELVDQGCIEDLKGQGEVFYVTNRGFEVADSLKEHQ